MTDSDQNPDPRSRATDLRSPPSRQQTMATLRWLIVTLVGPVLFLGAGVLLIIVLGLAQRLGWITSVGSSQGIASNAAKEVYTCSMHPQIRQPESGDCPICGMRLVLATASGTDLDDLSVRIEPAQRRLANIDTSEVQFAPISAEIHTVGAIAIDESRMATIASYIEGRLERLFADYTGVDVAKEDHLATIYSPELYAAQVEYVEIRKSLRSSSRPALATVRDAQERLAEGSRQRLVELGMTEDQIARLEETEEAQTRLTIYAPMGGTVVEKMAVEGKYVTAGEPIYRIADLSMVWLMLELYPEDSARIRFGQRVEAEMQSIPGKTFEGRVAFIDPRVDPQKRTVGVRVEFLNTDRKLRPGDYANAKIYLPIGQTGEVYDSELAGRWISPMHPQVIREQPGLCPICGMDLVPTSRYGYSDVPVQQPSSLYVPRSAVLMAGNNSVVYVESEPGRFEIRPVTLGPTLRDKVVILDGLERGESVATAGNFLIDSQMQLAGKPSLIDPTRALAARDERKRKSREENHRVAVIGEAGRDLEQMYAAYFRIQQSLASDQLPTETDSQELHRLAARLQSDSAFSSTAQSELATISEASEHLHHADLDAARHDHFRPISQAVLGLASSVRGASSDSFHHMHCPMVKGGSGDWLQATDQLRNPYFGSEMLECGDVVSELRPPNADDAKPTESADREDRGGTP